MASPTSSAAVTHDMPSPNAPPAAVPLLPLPTGSRKRRRASTQGAAIEVENAFVPSQRKPKARKRSVDRNTSHTADDRASLSVESTMSEPLFVSISPSYGAPPTPFWERMNIEPKHLASSEMLFTRHRALDDSNVDGGDCSPTQPTLLQLLSTAFRSQAETIDLLQGKCDAQQAQIEQLVNQLNAEKDAKEKKVTDSVEALKMEMMLDSIKFREAAEAREMALIREKSFVSRGLRNEQRERAQCEEKLRTSEVQREKNHNDMVAYREEAEHKQFLITTLEEDMEALRQLENDAATDLRRQEEGLPPAYASIDDAAPRPPYKRHKDNGFFYVERFNRDVRSEFAAGVQLALYEYKHLCDAEIPTNIANAKLFSAALDALSEAGTRLRRYLLYTAADVADTMFKLCWDMVGACELHPGDMKLDGARKARAGLAYQQIDSCLLESLRISFRVRHADPAARITSLAADYQAFCSQTEILRDKFACLTEDLPQAFLGRSAAWLADNVETERRIGGPF